MKCPVCGGAINQGYTNLPVELATGLIYIKRIPADICEQCGETFFSDEVAARIEEIVSKAKESNVEIEVIAYQGAA